MIKWFVDWAKAIYGGTKMWIKGDKFESDEEAVKPQLGLKEKENPYLLFGFWEFAIIATLTVVFFPLSLLFSLFFFGIDATIFLVAALFHDFVKTLLAILAIVIPIAILIIYLII